MEHSTRLAHISEDGTRTQTVYDHLAGTARLAGSFAAPFGAQSEAEFAAWLHDIGKYSDAFQLRLKGGPKVDHSTAGAQEAWVRQHLHTAFAVAGHHSGLPDGGSPADDPGDATLFGRSKKPVAPYDGWQEVTLPASTPPAWACADPLSLAFFTRMIYSCLVDADFIDTETFMDGKAAPRGSGTNIAALRDIVSAQAQRYLSAESPSPVSVQRNTVLRACLEKGAHGPQGLYTLTVPTGGGKTVEWRKWNTLEDAGALTEGVIPTGQKFGQSAVTQAITQYGTYVSVSDQLELHAIDDVILGAAEELGASAGTTQDKLVRNVAAAGTNVQYCDKVGTNGAHTAVTSRAGLDTTAKLTPDEVNKAVTTLKKMKAPKIDGKYVAIIHPSVAYDLRSSDAWVEAHKYAAPEEIFNGEIGELHGVRFIETTEAKIFNGEGCPVKTAADTSKGTPAEYYSVYATLFLGKDAYGMIDPEGGNLEMIIKDKGQVGGPLNQFSTLGYKFSSAAKILYEDRMVRVESCGAYSAEDEAN